MSARPGCCCLLLVLNPDGDTADEGHYVEEDVVTLAVLVREGNPDLGPLRVLAFTVADAVGDVAGLFGSFAVFRIRVLRHFLSPFAFEAAPSRPFRGCAPNPASRPWTPQAEKPEVHALKIQNSML